MWNSARSERSHVFSGVRLYLIECIFSHCLEEKRKISCKGTDVKTLTKGLNEETPCNVNERDCKCGNARQQLYLTLILVRLYITRARRERLRVARSHSHDLRVLTCAVSAVSPRILFRALSYGNFTCPVYDPPISEPVLINVYSKH